MGAASTLVKAICFVATPKGSMSLHWKNDRLGVGLGWDSRWPNKNRIRFSEDSHVFRSHICHFFVKIPWYIGWSLWWKTSDTGKMDGEYHLIKQNISVQWSEKPVWPKPWAKSQTWNIHHPSFLLSLGLSSHPTFPWICTKTYKSAKNLLSNGGCSWWFTLLKNTKSPSTNLFPGWTLWLGFGFRLSQQFSLGLGTILAVCSNVTHTVAFEAFYFRYVGRTISRKKSHSCHCTSAECRITSSSILGKKSRVEPQMTGGDPCCVKMR